MKRDLLKELEEIKELVLDRVDLDSSKDMILIDKLANFTQALEVALEETVKK